ncbi:MAG: AAA family ATPase [Anaerolineales bacterium]|nr:AAA family ATPase [Anaerolineales bacterium]
MTTTIAFAGKGGTGKTTVSALLIKALLSRTKDPILAIDADPASNLHMALGVPMPTTVGEIREETSRVAQQGQLGVSISRHDYLTHEIRMALEEGDQIDLLAMGRPEGQGCYCAINHLLRTIIDDLGRHYPYVVIDNEAGMEHISRRTTEDVDLLLLVTDPTVRGVRTAGSMVELARELEVNVSEIKLIVNRVQGDLPTPLQDAINDLDIEVAAIVPVDSNVNQMDAVGEPLINLDGDSPAWRAIDEMVDELLSP